MMVTVLEGRIIVRKEASDRGDGGVPARLFELVLGEYCPRVTFN